MELNPYRFESGLGHQIKKIGSDAICLRPFSFEHLDDPGADWGD